MTDKRWAIQYDMECQGFKYDSSEGESDVESAYTPMKIDIYQSNVAPTKFCRSKPVHRSQISKYRIRTMLASVVGMLMWTCHPILSRSMPGRHKRQFATTDSIFTV